MNISREQMLLQHYRMNRIQFMQEQLKIIPKSGPAIRLVLNTAQKFLDETLNRQLTDTGQVRAIILKGRQMGISTYLVARNFHRTALHPNVNTLMAAHNDKTIQAFLRMVDTYSQYCPFSPTVTANNKDEYGFGGINSRFLTHICGEKKSEYRGDRMSLLHCSEVAFWANADLHYRAAAQMLPPVRGSENIIESTSGGPDGLFYDMWKAAVAGESPYMPIFLPWFHMPEYAIVPERGFTLSNEPDDIGMTEVEYALKYGLDDSRMAWRRLKIAEMPKTGSAAFRQEYPADPEEAFNSTFSGGLFRADQVLRARRLNLEPVGAVIMAIDPAGKGKDLFTVAIRQGRVIVYLRAREDIEMANDGINWIKDLVQQYNPDGVVIDVGGMGQPIYDVLASSSDQHDLWHAVNFGSRSEEQERYGDNTKGTESLSFPANRRTEMWFRLHTAVVSRFGFSVPDDDEVQRDLLSQEVRLVNRKRPALVPKKLLKTRSPDRGDAMALTFSVDELNDLVVEEVPVKVSDFQSGLRSDPTGYHGEHGWMMGG